MRTEDELRRQLSDAAQRSATGSSDARARVGRLVRRQRAVRVCVAAGVAVALATFGLVGLTRPDHHASVRVISPGPTPSPTGVPGPEPDTASSAPAGQSDAVPAGFSAVSVTFVSPKDGFVLGSAPCTTRPCTVMLRTTDTGRTWHRIGAPPAEVTMAESGAPAVGRVRFATTTDGWVFGPDLWSTHDGGAHWTKVAHEGDVEDLAASAGRAHMIVLAPSGDQYSYRMWSTTIARDAWTIAPVEMPKGPAPIAAAQIVLQGHSGWALVDDRVVYDGVRLDNGTWVKWKPPCTDAFGPATLLAPTPTHLTAVCQEGIWGGDRPPGVGLYFSDDAGATFARASRSVPDPSQVAASPDADTVVVGSTSKTAAELKATFDRGKSWSSVYRGAASDQIVELGFTTTTQGIAIEQDRDHGTSGFLLTTDGGHHWKLSAFGPTASADRRCTTSDLRAALAEPASQGVSQQQTLTFALTNASASGCWLQGYPGISMLTQDGAAVPLAFERTGDQVITSKPPARVPLAPGGIAWISINKWVCQAPAKVAATTVRLIAPEERQPLSIALPLERQWAACDPSEPGHVVHVSPVAATPRATTAF